MELFQTPKIHFAMSGKAFPKRRIFLHQAVTTELLSFFVPREFIYSSLSGELESPMH
jgi:hypothetical protein